MGTRKFFFSILFVLLIITYIALHWATLMDFPYVHSDEAWLSGFSRTVLDKGSFQTREPFFDLYPRAIHGLRVIFVSAQMLVIKWFGYSIKSVRSLSLILSLLSLTLIYQHLKKIGANVVERLIMTSIIAFMTQFIMMSHVARQEPFILLGMVTTYCLMVHVDRPIKHLLIPAIIGLCIGVHPNSFIIGLSIGFLYLYQLYKGKLKLKDVILYILQLTLWASLFIGISFKLNPNFIGDYLAFGDQLGLVNHSLNRVQGFYYYYYKLWHQIGGTYILVPIRIDLILLLAGLLLCLYLLFNKRFNHKEALYQSTLMVLGINTGLFIIGRYNQTAIVFVLVFAWLMFFNGLILLKQDKKLKDLILPILCLLLLLELGVAYKTIKSTQHDSYQEFGQMVTKYIPENSRVLGNLNMDYHLNLYQLYDIRNLDYLDDHNLTFSDYIEKNAIDYIILYEEMTYIHDASGKWDILYGSLPYYEDMMAYIDKHTTEIDSFESPTYGMRIAKYVDVYPWGVKVYKVEDSLH